MRLIDFNNANSLSTNHLCSEDSVWEISASQFFVVICQMRSDDDHPVHPRDGSSERYRRVAPFPSLALFLFLLLLLPLQGGRLSLHDASARMNPSLGW
jgi:hypothetical protein